jgi:regulator of protease activity HflC (stomatin/prohibitin superfamily)
MQLSALLIPVVIIGFILINSIRIIKEYERGVLFTLGRFTTTLGPGLRIVIPFVQVVQKIDLRLVTMDVPSQDVISRDNVSVRVNAVVYFRVVDPEHAVIQVEDYYSATSQLAQTTLRSILGQHDLDHMLSEREKINADIQEILDRDTESWGIKVTKVELKHVDLNESMVRAMAKQAEAERERRAKIIAADGEFQAAQKLLDAARIIAEQPETMQLRYLQTLNQISSERGSNTIIFPVPMQFADFLKKIAQ